MAKTNRRCRSLSDIRIHEVSLVDRPANKIPFLFFKSEDSPKEEDGSVNKQKKIKITIESDGSVGGTTISINGKKVDGLKSFDFGFWSDNDPKQKIRASYTKVTSGQDGFNRTENYYLSKGEHVMNEQTLKALHTFLGANNVDFKKGSNEEDITKAVELINEHYKADLPEEFAKAIGTIATTAVGSFADTSEPESDSVSKSDENSEEVQALAKQVKALSDTLDKLTKKDEEKSELTKVIEALAEVSKRLTDLEKGGATRQSLSDQDDEGDETVAKGAGENGKFLWPSIAKSS